MSIGFNPIYQPVAKKIGLRPEIKIIHEFLGKAWPSYQPGFLTVRPAGRLRIMRTHDGQTLTYYDELGKPFSYKYHLGVKLFLMNVETVSVPVWQYQGPINPRRPNQN